MWSCFKSDSLVFYVTTLLIKKEKFEQKKDEKTTAV